MKYIDSEREREVERKEEEYVIPSYRHWNKRVVCVIHV